MLFKSASRRLPLPRLRALQNARLREQVAYACGRVPFYQHKLDALGATLARFRELGELVVTTLAKKATPTLRYWTNDLTNLY